MAGISEAPPSARARPVVVWWLALSAVAIALLAPLPYLTSSLQELARNDSGLAADYVDRAPRQQVTLFVHFSLAGVALLLSPLQFAARVRAARPALHRTMGRIILVCIGVSGVAGLILAPGNHAGLIGTAGFASLAVLWMACAWQAFQHARRRSFAAHRRWMIRTFALTYAAVTLRLWLGVLIATQLLLTSVDEDTAFDRAYLLVPFLCWVPNLIVAELVLRKEPVAAR